MNNDKQPCGSLECHKSKQCKFTETINEMPEGEKTESLVQMSILAIVMSDKRLHDETNSPSRACYPFSGITVESSRAWVKDF